MSLYVYSLSGMSSKTDPLQEAQITNDMFKSLAFRAKDVIVAVARSCHGMRSMAIQLEDDLRQLTRCALIVSIDLV